MLTTEQIDRIEKACAELPWEKVTVLALAAAHRTLPVYQVYSEGHAEINGYPDVHDGMVGVWRVLRARPGASAMEVAPRVEAAVGVAEADLDLINSAGEFGLPEALTAESISAATLALRAYVQADRSHAFGAMVGALEVDAVWAEGEADGLQGDGHLSWDRLVNHYGQHVRDIALLSGSQRNGEERLWRDIAMRAEREGMPFLLKMRELVSAEDS